MATIKKIMMLVFFVMVLASPFTKAHAQKMYIWCPNELTASPRSQLRDVEINLLINDTRILTSKIKDKCTPEELTNSLFELIKGTYPSAIINRSVDGKKKNEAGKIFIEIDIAAYYATFTSSMWSAQTNYLVKIADSREGSKAEYSREIQKEKRFFNVGGFATAKNNLNKSYLEANIELFDFISDKLIK